MKSSKAGDSIPINKPGLVQNWPIPNVIDAAYCVASEVAFWETVLGNKSTGLMLPISANTGMGVFLAAA